MLLDCFLKGMSLAVYIVVPLGAISVLYIKRTLQKGFLSGFISSLGVTTAEGFYAAAAIYGLTFISDFLLQWKLTLQLCGTVFLILIGVKTFFTNKVKEVKIRKKQKFISDYFSMLFLTLINPLTLVGFVTIFTTFGANNFDKNLENSLFMLLGFVTMSFSYCLVLITSTNFMKKKFLSDDSDLFKILNQISGLVIIIFTLMALGFALVK